MADRPPWKTPIEYTEDRFMADDTPDRADDVEDDEPSPTKVFGLYDEDDEGEVEDDDLDDARD